MKARTDQARTVIIGEARSPVGVSLGLRLIGDEEVATITLTQHDKTVTLYVADQAHAAQIAAAIQGHPPLAAPAAQGEPVAVPQVIGIGRDTSLPRAVILYLRSEPTDDDIRSIQDALRTGWVQPAEQQPFEWPLLDAPALIGGVVVGKGCSSRHVVMIAQRKYQYEAEHSPEEHARRKKAFQDALAQIRDGVGQQPDEAWSDDADSDSAAVAEAIRAREEAIAQVSGLQLQVAALVGALGRALDFIRGPGDFEHREALERCGCYACVTGEIIDSLAAHRKQGGEV